jgi:hypothetical protein
LSKILQLAVGSRDLSQAEKQIAVFTSWANSQTISFTQNDDFDHHFE